MDQTALEVLAHNHPGKPLLDMSLTVLSHVLSLCVLYRALVIQENHKRTTERRLDASESLVGFTKKT